MRRLRARGEPVQIVDIAAGHGRYVLDALRAGVERPESIVLRDYSERNVRDGEALIEAAKLEDIARFVNADAFDRASLAALRPRPTSVSSPDSTSSSPTTRPCAHRSPGSPTRSHPAASSSTPDNRGIPSSSSSPARSRVTAAARRGSCAGARKAKWTSWSKAAGFRKVAQRIDEWGIFTVSLAERVPQ